MSVKKKTKRKKRKVPKWKKRADSTSNGSSNPLWREVFYRATKGEFTEDQRCIVAVRASMMVAMRTFTLELGKNLSKCKTNLGLMLGTDNSVTSSITLGGTGEGGETEFVPTKLTMHIGTYQDQDLDVEMVLNVGEVQSLNEHIESLVEEFGVDEKEVRQDVQQL